MVEGRRTSARIKAEPGLKRRYSDALEEKATPSRPAKSAKTNAKSTTKHAASKTTAPAVQEPEKIVLPTKITDTTPLPILPEAQPEDLKDEEWQNMADSGVFAESLKRARQAIAKGAYFERFWTKPTATKKQKDMTEEEKAKLKAEKGPTHSKVGMVTMISEPLAFEVQILVIKDTSGTTKYKTGQLPPNANQLIYGTPYRSSGMMHTTPYRPQMQQTTTPVVTRPPTMITPNPAPPRPPAPAAAPPPPRPAAPLAPPRPAAPLAPPPKPAPAQQVSTRPSANGKPATNPPAPDPVIHALAQRASNNPELKAIMKIVATGKASPLQLQYFQRHIDELTEMVKKRQEMEAAAKARAQAASGAAQGTAAIPTPTVLRAPASGTTQNAGALNVTVSASLKPPTATPAPDASPAVPKVESTAPHTTSTDKPAASQAPQTPAVQSAGATSAPSAPTVNPVAKPDPIDPSSKAASSPQTAAIPRSSVQTTAPSQPPVPPSAPTATTAPPSAPVQRPPIPQSTPAPRSTPAPSLYQPPPTPATVAPTPRPTYTPSTTPRPAPQTTPSTTAPSPHFVHHTPTSTPHTFTTPPRPKGAITATPLHILLQFAENPHERFLFPKNAILEYNATMTEVIASFVVVKSVDKSERKVWAPVTLTFKGEAGVLSVLGRYVESLAVVEGAVEDVIFGGDAEGMERDREKEGFLALRLPKGEEVAVRVG